MGILHSGASSHPYDSNLYVSDSIGYRYTTSLQHIAQTFYYDFDKSDGLDGIYLANKVENWQDPNPQVLKRQTFLTFNNGGEWVEANPPRFDRNGKPVTCPPGVRCKLNLHGHSSYFSGNFGPFYSSPNARGLVLGTGNVGEYLTYDPASTNTYISSDAGYSWKEVRAGKI